jgi:hypothetical protein
MVFRLPKSQWPQLCLVFAFSFGVLGYGIDHLGIAAPYVDPIARLHAQDEATYANSALRMVHDGDWLTPKLMGRPYLFKPPLATWLAALSLRAFGATVVGLRMPVALLGAAGVTALFAWVAAVRSVTAGLVAAGLLLSNPLWYAFSRLCLTDVPAIACTTIALAAVALDPMLERSRTRWLFGIFAGFAVLAKSVAGLVPSATLTLWCLVAARRPRFGRVAATLGLSLLIAAPWHVYQVAIHPQWFWADYVKVQLFGFGLSSGQSGALEGSILFYLIRLVQMDPFLVLWAVLALPAAARESVSRESARPAVVIASCWLVVTIAALAAFQSKRIPYTVLLLPPLSILGGTCIPGTKTMRLRTAALLLGILVVLKLGWSELPWSLRRGSAPIPQARELRGYYALGREAELIIADPADDFYATTLPLPGLRYCFLDPQGTAARMFPHYVTLGITLSSRQFTLLSSEEPLYLQRLRSWGYPSAEPLGSAITLRTPADLTEVIYARPQSDFSLPAGWVMPEKFRETHAVWQVSSDRLFLLSQSARPRRRPIPAIPDRW